jgi:hypothetical protein
LMHGWWMFPHVFPQSDDGLERLAVFVYNWMVYRWMCACNLFNTNCTFCYKIIHCGHA